MLVSESLVLIAKIYICHENKPAFPPGEHAKVVCWEGHMPSTFSGCVVAQGGEEKGEIPEEWSGLYLSLIK